MSSGGGGGDSAAATVSGPLADSVLQVPRTSVHLTPLSFFVAWNGVLTLAFSGFPNSIVNLKSHVTSAFGLRAENSGSKWPKCTLGVLREGVSLSLEQLTLLRALCTKYEPIIAQSSWVFRPVAASAVVFQCRSLEKVLFKTEFPFGSDSGSTQDSSASTSKSKSTNAGVDDDDKTNTSTVLHADEVSESERARVLSVLDEFAPAPSNLARYLEFINRPGNRLSHYRDNHCETTFVCFLHTHRHSHDSSGHSTNQASVSSDRVSEADSPRFLPPYLFDFVREVDTALPGCYEWFHPSCLHVTLRTLT